MKSNEPHHFIQRCVHIQIVWRGDAIYLVKGTKTLVKAALEKIQVKEKHYLLFSLES